MSWIDAFSEAIKQATADGLTEFVMQYRGRYYYCHWRKSQWQHRLIELIGTEPKEV